MQGIADLGLLERCIEERSGQLESRTYTGEAPAVEFGVPNLGVARVDEASATSLSGTA